MSWNAEQVYELARHNPNAVFADKDGDFLGWDTRIIYYPPIKQEESIDDRYGPFTLHSGYVVIRPDQHHLMPSDNSAYKWEMYAALGSGWTEVRSSTVISDSITYRCSPKKPAKPEVTDDELHKLAMDRTLWWKNGDVWSLVSSYDGEYFIAGYPRVTIDWFRGRDHTTCPPRINK